jgi:hypothetical protein
MKRMPVDKIENDMVLAKEVCGKSGNVLLSKGAVLNVFMARRLKNWDIHFVYVEGEEESPEEENAVQVSPEEIRQRLEKKFAAVMHNVIMKQIFAAVLQHKLQKGG